MYISEVGIVRVKSACKSHASVAFKHHVGVESHRAVIKKGDIYIYIYQFSDSFEGIFMMPILQVINKYYIFCACVTLLGDSKKTCLTCAELVGTCAKRPSYSRYCLKGSSAHVCLSLIIRSGVKATWLISNLKNFVVYSTNYHSILRPRPRFIRKCTIYFKNIK